MSDIAIKVENISKQYRIGLKEELHDSLIGKVGSFLKSPFLNLIRLKKYGKAFINYSGNLTTIFTPACIGKSCAITLPSIYSTIRRTIYKPRPRCGS